jgi:hypothetical protein
MTGTRKGQNTRWKRGMSSGRHSGWHERSRAQAAVVARQPTPPKATGSSSSAQTGSRRDHSEAPSFVGSNVGSPPERTGARPT